MKKICICLVVTLLLGMYAFPSVASESSGSQEESNLIFSSFTDEKITSTGTPNWAKSSGIGVDFSDDVMTLTTANDRTHTNVYLNGTTLTNTKLGTAITANTAKFTLHTEIRIPEYTVGATNGTIIEAGIVLGNTVSADLGVSARFYLCDNGTERSDTYGNPRQVYARLKNNLASNAFTSDATPAGTNFMAGEWMSLDVLVDMTTEIASIYYNSQLIDTFTCTNARLKASGWKVGFRGYKGVSFRNFSVYEGLVVPVAQGITSAQVTLNEKIDIAFTARIPENKSNISTKIVYKDTIFEPECIVSQDAVAGYAKVTFTLSELLPQDIAELMDIRVYAGEELVAEKTGYSIAQYCMRLLPTYSSATSDASRAKLRDLLIALMNYGTESQQYFTEITESTVLANDGLLPGAVASVHRDMTAAQSVKNKTLTHNEAYYWKSATLALYNTIHLRLKFYAEEIDLVSVAIDGTTYTKADFVSLGNGVWCLDYDQIMANEFDRTVNAVLYVGDEEAQTVTYSVNSYVNSYVNAGKTADDASYGLIQAIYDYGCSAAAYAG